MRRRTFLGAVVAVLAGGAAGIKRLARPRGADHWHYKASGVTYICDADPDDRYLRYRQLGNGVPQLEASPNMREWHPVAAGWPSDTVADALYVTTNDPIQAKHCGASLSREDWESVMIAGGSVEEHNEAARASFLTSLEPSPRS